MFTPSPEPLIRSLLGLEYGGCFTVVLRGGEKMVNFLNSTHGEKEQGEWRMEQKQRRYRPGGETNQPETYSKGLDLRFAAPCIYWAIYSCDVISPSLSYLTYRSNLGSRLSIVFISRIILFLSRLENSRMPVSIRIASSGHASTQ